ncbi:MAG TPA: dihydropteroate synthase [Candidatus Angelobacter sp.]|nr:dihydropteroate synthase [Candidatus Angelobacter sp.]
MTADSQFYLKPAGLMTGTAAANACAEGAAARLGGGPVAFNAAEVIRRNGVARDVAAGGLSALRSGRLRDDADLSAAIEERLHAITAARPPLAGLTLDRPRLMGVVNVTPDSFSDGGRYASCDAAIAHGRALMAAGADILDIGGESTRPGAAQVSPDEELARVVPVIEALVGEGALVSIDTRRAAVMRAALAAGAHIVNDVTALAGDPESLPIVAQSAAAVVLMHMQGEPRTMQQDPTYRDAPLDIYDFFAERIAACAAAGIAPARLALDPGIGFGKRDPHNLAILADLALYHGLGCVLLLGVSRKSFIGRLSRGEDAAHRLGGSLAAALAGLDRGVQILRVHDVAETAQAIAIWQAIAGV